MKLACSPDWFHNATIMNITIKDLPEGVHARLKSRAEETGRSLNKMIVYTLERAVRPTPIDRENLLAEIEALREKSSLRIEGIDEVQAAIEEGRK